MPSFDVVNQVDLQEISNAINNAQKEIAQRYDFRGSNTAVDFDRKTKLIVVTTEDDMKMEAVREMLVSNMIRRKVEASSLEFKETQPAGGKTLRREVVIKEGIDRDVARDMVKDVKESKIKVQASIQGEELRVSGKKRDDLQEAIAFLKSKDYGIPLQFINMRD